MDNLIAAHQAVPMLVVMERGYGTMQGTSQQQTVPYDPALYTVEDITSRQLFAELVISDLIPTIDGRYRTIADPEHRAIAGLSRGADQASLTSTHSLTSGPATRVGLASLTRTQAAFTTGFFYSRIC
jgi:enterochelin esterase-like enzyme